jgi:hypothetical protein
MKHVIEGYKFIEDQLAFIEHSTLLRRLMARVEIAVFIKNFVVIQIITKKNELLSLIISHKIASPIIGSLIIFL